VTIHTLLVNFVTFALTFPAVQTSGHPVHYREMTAQGRGQNSLENIMCCVSHPSRWCSHNRCTFSATSQL